MEKPLPSTDRKEGNESDGSTVVDLSAARNSSPLLPKDYKNEEDAPWFVHNTEDPAIADEIQRRTDVYVRRIQHAIHRTDTYRKRKQDDPNYYEYGANGKIDLGWYNDLVAAAEDENRQQRWEKWKILPAGLKRILGN